jgi:general secretion pathway protein M
LNWFRVHRRSAVFVLLTLLIPALLLLRGLFGIASVGAAYASEASRIEPRLARLQGLLNEQALLAQRSEEAERLLRQVAYPAEQDATALAAALQADVRQLMDAAGMYVSNSQVLPVKQEDLFERVTVKLTVSGTTEAFSSALAALSAQRPQLLIEALDAFPERDGRRADESTAQVVKAVVQVFALRQVRPA